MPDPDSATAPAPSPDNSAALPAATLQGLLDHTGVREFIICAGARNSALLVLLAAIPGLRLWHHFEERSAAFFALGRIMDHENPVAVITTSGTAAAELLPAVIEAHYQGLPLIALTADRPAHYRKTGAPQAIEQEAIFGPYPSLTIDLSVPQQTAVRLAGLASWDRRAPLHVNLCLEEPSAADLPPLRLAGSRIRIPDNAELALSRPKSSDDDPSGNPPAASPITHSSLILVGDLLSSEIPVVAAWLETLPCPIHAEAASGLRESPALASRLLRGGDEILAKIPHESVIRIGGVPSCRFWRDLELNPNIPVTHFTRSGHPGLARPSVVRPIGDLPFFTLEPSHGAVSVKDPPSHYPIAGTTLTSCLEAHPASEPALIRQLSRLIPAGAVVFTGNSLAIRQWNLCAAPAQPCHARALRGANGIDGNLSAFLGLAADAGEAWCLVGDLTALYDPAALWMVAQLDIPRLRIVIIQNAGGKIFSQLPSLAGLTAFEKQLMENPHGISFEGWARQWGLEHRTIHEPKSGLTNLPPRAVIELHPRAEATQQFRQAWQAANRALP
ncbi:MAG: 2-succinyl-5-enolpyruvyl-6-hydroxy-3-cyclohexene-carboxylate synthase [Verrucomicrobiales bacterium]|nr:2-succinyl-5-enolpyruvyl-6-hydroxy-3-cyclohexene-carboxylate synthase [Verrucomicrobiales bacterium]